MRRFNVCSWTLLLLASHTSSLDETCSDGFICDENAKCLARWRFCDGEADCSDGTDEIYLKYLQNQTQDGVLCRVSAYTSDRLCLLPTDQAHKIEGICHEDETCSDGFICDENAKCLARWRFCNEKADCSDGTDEIYLRYLQNQTLDGALCRGSSYTSHHRLCLLPTDQAHKKEEICHKDETCSDGFICDENAQCLAGGQFCDEKADCSDGTDEIYLKYLQNQTLDGVLCRGSSFTYDPHRLCLLPTDQAHKKEEICHKDETCSEGFLCDNCSRCIKPRQFCNGNSECSDGTDEIYLKYLQNRTLDGALCRGSSDWLCFLPTDQAHKKKKICLEDETCSDGFICDENAKCLVRWRFCDNKADCSDRTDEIYLKYLQNRTLDGVVCRATTSMHPHRLCLLPTDQAHKREEICHKDETCSDGFLCDNRSRCVKPRQFCDGRFGCRDGTDEIYQRYYTNQTRNGVICRQKKYPGQWCLLPVDQADKKAVLCDKDDTCSDGFACADGRQCIEASQYCHMDTYGICKDGSQDTLYNASEHTEADGIPCRLNNMNICLLPANQVFKKNKLCIGDETCSDGFLCSSGDRCIEPWQFCNGDEDCGDGGDEVSYNEWNHNATDGIPCRNVGAKHVCMLPRDQARKQSSICAAGKAPFAKSFFTCFDDMDKALPTRQLCDDVIQCNDFTDECLCEFGTGLSSHPACDKITWEPDSPCGVMFPCSENNGTKCLNATKICNKMPDCEDSKDEDRCPNTTLIESHQRTTKKPCKMKLQGNVRRVPEDHMYCDGKYNCDDKSDESRCRYRFYCTNEQPVNIPREYRCDTVKDCEDWSDELDCTHSKRRCKGKEGYHRATMLCKTHFYCNDGGERVVISSRKVCDGNTDCFSGADECEPWCIDSAFSSAYSLLDQPAITPFIWTISLVALIGNIGVASFTGKSIIRPKFELSPHQMAQKILVLNLAVADFLVGVYTMSVCVQNVRTKGQYCLVDQLWRSGTACSVLGAILVIGSEESVFALTIITAFRLKAVVRPFASTSAKLIWFCMIASWSIALMVGFIPLAPSAKDYFRESMWYSENPLFSTLPWEDVRNLSKRLIAYQNQTSDYVEDHGGLGSWSLLEKLIANLNPEFIPARTFGYYSAHGVCLPRLFPDREKIAAWSYSLGIIIFNFISFLFILIAYIFIYKLATKSNIRKTSNVARATSLQRKVTRIVITDFLCWMPICIMVIMQVSGVDIHPDVYIPVGTILIPINSALNPFLYSDAPEWCWKKIRIMRSWLARAFAPLCAQDVKVEPQEVEDLRVIEDGNQERIKIHAASRKAKKKKTSGNEVHTMVTLTKCTSESKHD